MINMIHCRVLCQRDIKEALVSVTLEPTHLRLRNHLTGAHRNGGKKGLTCYEPAAYHAIAHTVIASAAQSNPSDPKIQRLRSTIPTLPRGGPHSPYNETWTFHEGSRKVKDRPPANHGLPRTPHTPTD